MKNLPAAQTPFDTLTEALGGLMVGHCLTSVTNFKVADALGDTPQTAAELAADTGTDPEALHRMLRLLAAHGVFAYSEDASLTRPRRSCSALTIRTPCATSSLYSEPPPPRSTWAAAAEQGRLPAGTGHPDHVGRDDP